MSSATPSLRSSPGLTPSSDSTHFHYTHSSINLASLPGSFASSNGSRDNVGRPSDSTGFHDGQDQNHQGLQTALQRMGLTDRSTGGSDNPPQLPPDFSFKPSGLSPHAAEAPVDRSQTGSRNEGYSPLDDFRFPASTFDSPVFPHASYATSNGQDGSRSSSRFVFFLSPSSLTQMQRLTLPYLCTPFFSPGKSKSDPSSSRPS